ncbi:putative lipopolysaccharide heptosyltransferase III [Candidatus Manganitrophus noduliformans]|uniref:Putative lipopolysaccharide heptosyltransferase III n=1 Tax=Candidatus Manganitrophus noduliformans TaxID=2606439 RepID=A0A7X6DPM4_9BACT|nr:putative lipopolysaccharide heptosyltransferase III [Candidatus Manganitrophus noduliformans]NKE70972.1 putative lipopolysaccharide heptosyltransferase III [Candidatus Manganitrophus noduliformans]
MIDFRPEAIKSVLLMLFRQIGDVLLATPTIRAFKEAFPGSRLSVVVFKESAPVLEGNPFVDRIVVVDPKWKGLPLMERLWRERLMLSEIRETKADLAVNLTTGDRGLFLSLLSGAPRRLGLLPRERFPLLMRLIYTHRYRVPTPHTHAVERHLESIRSLGYEPIEKRPQLFFSKEEEDRVVSLLTAQGWSEARQQEGRYLVQIHPTSRLFFKCWQDDAMGAVIDHLIGERNVDVVVTGGPAPAEREKIERILSFSKRRPMNLVGQTSLRELAALSRRADLFFGVDSAPMHIAAAMATPVIALFGPSVAEIWRPWGAGHTTLAKDFSCLPCGQDGCGGSKRSRCLEETTAEEVIVEIDRYLLHLDAMSRQPSMIRFLPA